MRTVLEELEDPAHVLFKPKDVDTFTEKEFDTVLRQVKKLAVGTPKVPFDAVEKMNEEWALMIVSGAAEFVNMRTGAVSNLSSWRIITEPMRDDASARSPSSSTMKSSPL